MKKNEIIRIYGTEFKENTVRLLREAELASLIPAKDARIGIKPNLVSASEASFGATTHPEIVAGIIEYLKEEGFSNIVYDRRGILGGGQDVQGIRTLRIP